MPREKKKPPDPADAILQDVKWLLRDFKKSERSDVALRRVENRDVEFSIVKTTWKSFCEDAGRALTFTVETAMRELDKTICEAYVLANLHVSRVCEMSLTLPKLDQQFFYSCLSAVSQAKTKKGNIKDHELKETVAIYDSWRPEGISKPDSTNLSEGFHQNASLQMATNAANMIELTFYNRFKRYLRHKYHLDGTQAYQRLQSILSREELSNRDTIIDTYRPLALHVDLKRRPESALPLLYMFSQYAEEENEKLERQRTDRKLDSRAKLVRLFSLLPHKNGFGASHIKICQSGLYNLLRKNGQDVKRKDFDENTDAWWKRLFDISRFETRNRKFAGEILTDAVGVSIVLKKPKSSCTIAPVKKGRKNKKANLHLDNRVEEFDIDAYDQVWGLDPGRKDLFVASDQDDEVKKCSVREFYHCAKYKLSVRKNRRWIDRNPEVRDTILALPTKRTSNLETLRTYVQAIIPKLDTLIGFFSRRRMRAMKFTRFRFCQKKLHELCVSLTERAGRKTVIGFGDWSNQDAGVIKKCQSGPVKRLERQLKRYSKVVSIDEFRTSKLCQRCHQDLTNERRKVVGKDFRLHTMKVHGVLHCRNSDCSSMTVNRDVNASKNMRDLLIGGALGASRAWAFSRANKNLVNACLKSVAKIVEWDRNDDGRRDRMSCSPTLQ